MAGDFGAEQGLQADALCQKIRHRPQAFLRYVSEKEKPDRLQSDPTVNSKAIKQQDFVHTASIALHKKIVTVRQIFSDDPAWKIQAFSSLRRSSLSPTAAAWPCGWVLMKPAPLSKRFNFSLY